MAAACMAAGVGDAGTSRAEQRQRVEAGDLVVARILRVQLLQGARVRDVARELVARAEEDSAASISSRSLPAGAFAARAAAVGASRSSTRRAAAKSCSAQSGWL